MRRKNAGLGYSVALRALAALLVVALLASVLLYRKTDVPFSAENLENRSAQVAAQMLTGDGSYAAAPRLTRMGVYLKSLLMGMRSSADCETAAQIAIAQADFESATAFMERALELFDGPEAERAQMVLRMGYLYTLQGKYEDALQWLDKGLSYGEVPEARLTRAQVRLNLGDIPGARDDVEACLQELEDPEPILPDVINVFEAAGEYGKAAECCTRLIESTGEAEYLLNRAYCYSSMGRMDEAAADCAAYGQAGGPQTVQAEIMLGLGWMSQSQYRKAGDCYVKALDAGCADPESLYYYVVLCAYITEDYARVSDYGERMIRLYQSGGRTEQADIDMEDTTGRLKVTLVPVDIASLSLMTGAAHMRLEEFDRAVECLSLCLEKNPEASLALYLRGSSLLALERHQEAEADFDAAMAAGEDEEKCRYGRALCRMQLGETDGAMEDFDWVLLNGSDEALFEVSSRLMEELMRQSAAGEKTNNGE